MRKQVDTFLRRLVQLGHLEPWQLQELLEARRNGDERPFGDLVVERRYMQDTSVKRFLDFLEREGEAQAG